MICQCQAAALSSLSALGSPCSRQLALTASVAPPASGSRLRYWTCCCGTFSVMSPFSSWSCS